MSFANSRMYSYIEFMMALTIWREARGERREAMEGVAWVIRNRVNRALESSGHFWWGNDFVGVITKPFQFSSITDPHDPQLTKFPQQDDGTFGFCLEVAGAVLDDLVEDPTGGSSSYHDLSISPPAWATPERFAVQLGRLRFYRVDME